MTLVVALLALDALAGCAVACVLLVLEALAKLGTVRPTVALLVVALTSSCALAHEPTPRQDAAPAVDAGERLPAFHPPRGACPDLCWYFDSTPNFGVDGGER